MIEISNKIKEVSTYFSTHSKSKGRYMTRKGTLGVINRLVIHCSDSSGNLESVMSYDAGPNHISKEGLPNLTYHYWIDRDYVAQTLPLNVISWHVGQWNNDSIGACLRYRATGAMEPPSKEQMLLAVELASTVCLQLKMTPDQVVGHRELPGTGYDVRTGSLRKECPGILLDMTEFRYNVAKCMQTTLGLVVDGMFGPKSKKALLAYIPNNGIIKE